jgi:hypothetical protein
MRSVMLIVTTASSALLILGFDIYHGPMSIKIGYVIWFGLLGQMVLWRLWLAASERGRNR